jgi:hypothetical protein
LGSAGTHGRCFLAVAVDTEGETGSALEVVAQRIPFRTLSRNGEAAEHVRGIPTRAD